MVKVISKVAFATASSVLFAILSTAALASDDGDVGPPRVFNDQALGESLYALNHHIQTQYIRDDIYAGLDVASERDFEMIASTVGYFPEITKDIAESDFGPPISSGSSLDTALAHFNAEVLMRGEDLFIQVVRAETDKGLSFSDVAAVKGHNEADRALAQLNRASEFGNAIHDDSSLDVHVVALSEFIYALEEREERLAFAPTINSLSFDHYTTMLAMH